MRTSGAEAAAGLARLQAARMAALERFSQAGPKPKAAPLKSPKSPPETAALLGSGYSREGAPGGTVKGERTALVERGRYIDVVA